MNDFVLARVLHIIGVVFWIGGVAMVTTVLLPAVRAFKEPQQRIEFFERIESRFAWQARVTTLITGGTGFYMLYRMDGWSLFSQPSHWWLHAMVMVWVIFTMVLFVLEPLVLRRLFRRHAKRNPEKTFRIIQRMHWILLTASLITIFGAAAGSHGWLFW